MKPATKKLNFNFKVVDVKDASGEVIIEGYANTCTKDRVGDVVLPKAFEASLETYLKNPVILLNHDWNDVIGRCIHAEITDKGLFIRARISDTREDIKTLIREKCYSTFSIGYNEIDAEYDESTKTKYIKELELLEISVVSVPANTEAMFTEITEKTENDKPEKKTDGEKKARTAGELKAFIATVKEVVGKGFDDECLNAVIDYFNSEEELMNKKSLIELLKAKTLPEQNQPADAAKTEEPQSEEKPQMDIGEALKAMAAKLDMVAEALAQVMEKLDKPASEEQPKEDEEEKEASDEADKEDEAKEDEEEKEASDKAKEDKAKEDEEEKELSDAEIEKELAELSAQISALDEIVNG